MSSYHARQALTKIGVFPGDTTPAADLRALVEALRVRAIETDLIKTGATNDGGYIMPDDLDGIAHCFSPGVAGCSAFELEMADRGMMAFLADRSVDGPAAEHDRFRFIKKFIACTDDPDEGLITMDSWYQQEVGPLTEDRPDALLQMDIEGAEYEVLNSASNRLLKTFRIMVIEFHRLHQLADRYSFAWISRAFYKLLQTHSVVHIHPNNNKKVLHYKGISIPATLEFTFLRNDRMKPSGRPLAFPHPLDHKTVHSKPDVVLPACWYAGE